MIDWASLVADCAAEQAENPDFGPVFPQKVGTDSGEVGTKTTSQAIEKKHVFESVPTVPSVPTVFERTRVSEDEKNNLLSFPEPGGGGVQRQSAPHKTTLETSCRTCAHFRRPGLSDGYCCERDDLPPAYTPGHPLRKLPDDGGASCTAWRLHPYM
ncbi:hypothetical protein ZRA01_37120 [Zoogloea ramigera]|uniref:Uncharacterized protein n=1 Tax=Zoogloea ramigera TaxID=350 RepID=A0A4Y4D115_ZOORA|nr:hypothetical protein [Zoogloea ramigera]GEC97639.1 hypothetical protein ZRA01_37120 [Zoogloea ramigera]